jgi:ankyrin repeat protein
LSFFARLFNRRSKASIAHLNYRFLNAIPRDWNHSGDFEKQLTATLLRHLDNGADIDTQDGLGWSALTRLAIWGYTMPAIALLERKADVNLKDKCNMTAIWGAVQNNNIELLKCMFDKGATALDQKFISSGLMAAAIRGQVHGQEDREKKIACIEMLIQKGLSIGPNDKPSAWRYPYLAPYCPGLAEAKEIEAACETGDIAKIRDLAAKGFKPDILAEFGQDTPLFKAARKGDIGMMAELIKLGSDLNIMCSWSDRTPLMAAAESGKMEAFELLVDSGVEIAAHVRYERHSYDEPGHSYPDLFQSARAGGPAMVQRVGELFEPTIILQRRAKVMRPLRFRT